MKPKIYFCKKMILKNIKIKKTLDRMHGLGQQATAWGWGTSLSRPRQQQLGTRPNQTARQARQAAQSAALGLHFLLHSLYISCSHI